MVSGSMDDDLQKYTAYVTQLAIREDGTVFSNRGPDHARVVLGLLLAKARVSVRILSGSMKSSSLSFEAIKRIHKSGVPKERIQIILVDPPEFWSRDVPLVVRKGIADVRVLRNGSHHHFAVVDDRHYRWENEIATQQASFGFACVDQANNMSKLFGLLWEKAEPVSEALLQEATASLVDADATLDRSSVS